MRILCWLLGLINDAQSRGYKPSPPTRPVVSVCHMNGCHMPAHPGHVLCEGHLIADRIGFYNPDSGWTDQ